MVDCTVYNALYCTVYCIFLNMLYNVKYDSLYTVLSYTSLPPEGDFIRCNLYIVRSLIQRPSPREGSACATELSLPSMVPFGDWSSASVPLADRDGVSAIPVYASAAPSPVGTYRN